MFHRLHTQLTLFCTFITGLILILMVCVCLLISESGLRQQSRSSFIQNLSSLYQEIQDDSTLSLEWLSQVSHNYGVFLQITDRGIPLFYQQIAENADVSALFDAARQIAAAQYKIDLGSSSGPQNKIRRAEFSVKFRRQTQDLSSGIDSGSAPADISESEDHKNLSAQNTPQKIPDTILSGPQNSLSGTDAWASAALIPKVSGSIGVIVLQPLTALSARIWRQRLFFGAACLAGLLLLFLFSWHFTARMLAPIEENRRRQTQFIAAASHELRSPLTVMLSCTSAVRNGIAPDPDAYLGTVEAEGMRMSRLIGDMLMLANADNHSWNIHPAPAELDTLLLQTWESFETLARSRGFKWEIRLPEEPVPPCVCDRERIVQVLEILIDNAFSYTPEGCRICLSMEYVRHGEHPGGAFHRHPLKKYADRVSCTAKRRLSETGSAKEQSSSTFFVYVSDNGPGIPDTQKEIIFERFQRLDDSRKDKSHFGLGLPIAKEIISLHGGTLSLEDTPGGGATFRILLPGK